MILVQPTLSKAFASGLLFTYRKLHINAGKFKRTVLISQCNDIFTNLALEDWLYTNYDFTNQQILMLWQNNPCVVIGRFQNPWLEANIGSLPDVTHSGVQLARRYSGGGTVYHDRGNLNLTFFTSRDAYNRKHNLELISRAVFRECNIKLDISPREDLVIRDLKVSGTASKLGRLSAYHHCTLLVNADKINLSMALQKNINSTEVKTNATRSIRSKIMNLSEENPSAAIDNLLTAIGNEYMQPSAPEQNSVQLINPTEESFPGLTDIRDNLISWDWRYGQTPQFTLTKSFTLPIQFLDNCDVTNNNLTVTMIVEQGRVIDVTLTGNGFGTEAKRITDLKGQKFTEQSLNRIECGLMDEKGRFVTECVQRVMMSL